MKKYLFLILIFVSVSSFATERVVCHDEKNEWTVNYQLEANVLTDLTFSKNGQVIRNFPGELVASTTTLFRKTFFETTLGTLAYFDFERKRMNPQFTGEFLLENNPLGFETPVSCSASPF